MNQIKRLGQNRKITQKLVKNLHIRTENCEQKLLNYIYGSRHTKKDQDILRLFLRPKERVTQGLKKAVKFIVALVVP